MTESANQAVLAHVTRRPAAGIVNVASDLDKADVVAIAAVRFEEQLETAKGQLGRRIANLNAQIAQGEADLKKACQALADGYDCSGEKAATLALKQAGLGTYEVTVGLDTIDENRQQVSLSIALSTKGGTRSYYSSQALTKEIKLPFSPQAKEILKGLRGSRQAVAEINKQLAEVHKRLSNLPALERKTRAKLAENALADSEEGKKILEQLASVTEGSLPQFMLTDGR